MRGAPWYRALCSFGLAIDVRHCTEDASRKLRASWRSVVVNLDSFRVGGFRANVCGERNFEHVVSPCEV